MPGRHDGISDAPYSHNLLVIHSLTNYHEHLGPLAALSIRGLVRLHAQRDQQSCLIENVSCPISDNNVSAYARRWHSEVRLHPVLQTLHGGDELGDRGHIRELFQMPDRFNQGCCLPGAHDRGREAPELVTHFLPGKGVVR